MTEAAMSTDREIWREREGDYYADSIHVTKEGNIGIDCGGTVYVKPVRAWHALASAAPSPEPSEDEVKAVARAICALEHDPDGPTSDIYIPDDPDAIYVWAGFRPHARAAIAAMRPTLSEEDRAQLKINVAWYRANEKRFEAWCHDPDDGQTAFGMLGEALSLIDKLTNQEPTDER